MAEPTNREQRRHPEILEDAEAAKANAQEQKLIANNTTQDVSSVRAKNSGHGKKTADKWNQ